MQFVDGMTRKKKYVPSLPRLIRMCERNYGQLMSLLPDLETESLTHQFQINSQITISIKIITCSRYTTELEVEQHIQGPDFLEAKMRVRLYHDASAAEVTSFQHVGNFKGAYPYPNQNMFHPNEKEQLNFFLAEWLAFCHQHQSQDDPKSQSC